jgi:DNA-binding NarL/FixJ family response regulator
MNSAKALNVWIVDDDASIRWVLERASGRAACADRSTTPTARWQHCVSEPDVLVTDIRMPGGSGIDLLAEVKKRLPGLPVIIMTAYSDLDSAVSSFQGGAFEACRSRSTSTMPSNSCVVRQRSSIPSSRPPSRAAFRKCSATRRRCRTCSARSAGCHARA